jgi:hypothetical protein
LVVDGPERMDIECRLPRGSVGMRPVAGPQHPIRCCRNQRARDRARIGVAGLLRDAIRRGQFDICPARLGKIQQRREAGLLDAVLGLRQAEVIDDHVHRKRCNSVGHRGDDRQRGIDLDVPVQMPDTLRNRIEG